MRMAHLFSRLTVSLGAVLVSGLLLAAVAMAAVITGTPGADRLTGTERDRPPATVR